MNDKLRIIDSKQITDAVAELCIDANIIIGDDIRCALERAKDAEMPPLASSALGILIDNIDIAERERLPVCQDTGMAVVFIDIGGRVHIDGSIENAVNEGVRQGYRKGCLRSSIVRDPIHRVNTGDNTPAVIHYDFVPGENIIITVAPKGFGSENMSAVRMLTPSDGIEGVEDFVIETVKKAGACPCPPIIVGIGIGGTMEKAAILSKKALLREVGSANPDSAQWAATEQNMLARINDLGIGISGYGGAVTALGVHILTYPAHIAGLPVAVNIGCHATRHKTHVL